MARFIYVATIFQAGLDGRAHPSLRFWRWRSRRGLARLGQRRSSERFGLHFIQDRVAGARELTVVVPVPIAIQFLGIQAHIERLKIFASKPSEPLGVQFSWISTALTWLGKSTSRKAPLKWRGVNSKPCLRGAAK